MKILAFFGGSGKSSLFSGDPRFFAKKKQGLEDQGKDIGMPKKGRSKELRAIQSGDSERAFSLKTLSALISEPFAIGPVQFR